MKQLAEQQRRPRLGPCQLRCALHLDGIKADVVLAAVAQRLAAWQRRVVRRQVTRLQVIQAVTLTRL